MNGLNWVGRVSEWVELGWACRGMSGTGLGMYVNEMKCVGRVGEWEELGWACR